ncbi:hypothetical protein MTO96_018909 [Rhipicephalus appendiculatus]
MKFNSRSSDVAEEASSSPPLGAQREQLERGAADVLPRQSDQVRACSDDDDTSLLSLDMKELGVESDEDVGLGLDFEEDDEEFRKCIEDDSPGASLPVRVSSPPDGLL